MIPRRAAWLTYTLAIVVAILWGASAVQAQRMFAPHEPKSFRGYRTAFHARKTRIYMYHPRVRHTLPHSALYPRPRIRRLRSLTGMSPLMPAVPIVSDGMVWVNTKSGIYWRQGSRYYGHTRQGRYLSEQEAIQGGYRAGGR